MCYVLPPTLWLKFVAETNDSIAWSFARDVELKKLAAIDPGTDVVEAYWVLISS